MGRPREHDERTAAALLEAAERAIEISGPEGISVRGVARGADTTTRAVYSVFGSKQGLVAALVAHAFDLLRVGLERLPVTPAPDNDLVEAGLVIRQFAVEHPSLFRIAFRNTADPFMRSSPLVRSASRASLDVLQAKVVRLDDVGVQNGPSVKEATFYFRAMCDGLAGLELGGTVAGELAELRWREGLGDLVRGFAAR